MNERDIMETVTENRIVSQPQSVRQTGPGYTWGVLNREHNEIHTIVHSRRAARRLARDCTEASENTVRYSPVRLRIERA